MEREKINFLTSGILGVTQGDFLLPLHRICTQEEQTLSVWW